jgi:UDP-2-acetamido-3-amino-2,3-dideoxy-glucuronate N-acetyltransferase
MKVWLLGAGYWGGKIADTITSMGHDLHIVDIRNGHSIHDITDTSPVIIATPLWQHQEQAAHLIRQGNDVYIEKPAAETSSQIRQLMAMTQQGQIVTVGHIYMHNAGLAKVKQMINSIGQVRMVQSQRSNLGIYQTNTTALLSLAPHDFSILHDILGVLTVDHAQGWRLNAASQQLDRIQVTGQAVNNVQWQIDVSWLWPVRQRVVTVVGDKGSIIWDDDTKSIILKYHQLDSRKLITGDVLTYTVDTDPLHAELSDFLQCVQQRTQPRVTLSDAVQIALYIDRSHDLLNITV